MIWLQALPMIWGLVGMALASTRVHSIEYWQLQ